MTNTTENQSVLAPLLTILGEQDADGLLAAASNGETIETESGLIIEAGGDQVSANFFLEDAEPYTILGWQNPWKFTMGDFTIEDGKLTLGSLNTWQSSVQAALNSVTFAKPADKDKAQNILDAIVQVLATRLPAPSASPWPFADDLLTRCGSADAAETLTEVMVRTPAVYINTGGFTVHSPRTWEKAPEGTATLLQVFEFGEDTRDSFAIVVQDYQIYFTANFGGVKFDSLNAMISDLKLWALSATERFLASSPTLKQLGKFHVVLGQFILAAEEYLAAKAE